MSDKPIKVTATSPCRVWHEKDIYGTVHIKAQHKGFPEFDFVQIQYNHAYTDNAHQKKITDAILNLLGAD